jgi:hypothetical protein
MKLLSASSRRSVLPHQPSPTIAAEIIAPRVARVAGSARRGVSRSRTAPCARGQARRRCR